MSPLALGLCAVAAFTDVSGFDGSGTYVPTWLNQYGQTSVFRAALTPSDANGLLLTFSLTIDDQNTQGGSGGVFCGFDLDFILFDYDGTLNGNEFGEANAISIVPGTRSASAYYNPTALHPGVLFGLDAGGEVMEGVATLDQRDATYVAGAGFGVDTSSGWVSLGDGGSLTALFQDVAIPGGSTLYVYIGDAGQRSYTFNGTTYYENPLITVTPLTFGPIPEPGAATLLVLGAGAAMRRRRRRVR